MPDVTLANLLCSRLMERNNERHRSCDEGVPNRVRSIATSLVQATLNVQLPAKTDSEPSMDSKPSVFTHNQEQMPSQGSSDAKSGIYDPTLAPSNNSLELLSMLKLSVQIRKASKRPTSFDKLSDSMSSMNLSLERSSQQASRAVSLSARSDTSSVLKKMILRVGFHQRL
jgi:hypothetical protein